MARSPAVRFAGKAIGWAIIAGAVFAAYWALSDMDRRPRTDAAEIDAPVVHISSNVPGRIIAFRVENNASVKQGDILFEIDPEPFRLRLEQARAEVRAAESEVAQGGRNIATMKTNAEIADEQIRRARSNLQLAEQTLARLEPLLPRGFVSAQQVDQARTARRDADVSLQQALQQSKAASQIIGTLETRQAQLAVATATAALAERDLRNTVIRAPFDGKIVGLTRAAGEFVITGQGVFTLISTARWEAVANFRESDLGNITIGSEAEVFVMADRNRLIRGSVRAIGWGVRSDDSLNLFGIPIIARSLNWVRVAKRYPVYIHLHDPPDELMRIGASAVVVLNAGPPAHGTPHDRPHGTEPARH